MKTIYKILIPVFILPVLLFSCQPAPIDIDVPASEQKMVVASQIIPNQIMIVLLTRSFSALNGFGSNGEGMDSTLINSLLVSGAQVKVKHPGGETELFMVSPGVYVSLEILQELYGEYSLWVKDSLTGQELSATTTLMPSVNFTKVEPDLRHVVDTIYQVYLKYEFEDIADKVNYYLVGFYSPGQGGGLPTGAFGIPNNMNSGFELLTDANVVDGKISKEIFLPNANATDTVGITVANISRQYYDFLAAFKRAGGLFNQLTGEPITYPTNVVNGYGFFNAYFPDIWVLDLNEAERK